MNKIIPVLMVLFLGIFETKALEEGEMFEVGDHRYKLTTCTNFSGDYPAVAVSVRGQLFREFTEIGQRFRYSAKAGVIENGIFYLLYEYPENVVLQVNGLVITQIPSAEREKYSEILKFF